ncbi:MAG: hypothetical protein DMG38_08935 [Acidobacteria bacterium]|nr:MAG: hypothetical protein DMG38_08935 [Acidobacteriota bacterium]
MLLTSFSGTRLVLPFFESPPFRWRGGVLLFLSAKWNQNVPNCCTKEACSLINTKTIFVLAITSIASGASLAAQKQAQPRLPYTAVHDPQFIPASSATFLHDPDRVIGITAGAVAKAYPAAILSQHGLVEDQSPSGPIAVTW